MRIAKAAIMYGALASLTVACAGAGEPRDDLGATPAADLGGASRGDDAGRHDDVGFISAAEATPASLAPSDCSLDSTAPGPRWQPELGVLRIPVVVHVIADGACAAGNVSDETVVSQIAILNEDYRALAGTPGAAGADAKIEFFLADRDPQGAPTNGITRSCNTAWHQDQGEYWLSLAWAPSRYLNLYTNNASGARGYVPFLPADPAAAIGQPRDRVVINWLTFGRDSPFSPHDQGRTATHEVGHYLGLFHTYYEGCGAAEAPSCYATGDRLCDTAPNAAAHDGCPANASGCGGVPAPVSNYMELTDDACMTGFTAEQAQRMRCTLGTYRPGLLLGPLSGKVP